MIMHHSHICGSNQNKFSQGAVFLLTVGGFLLTFSFLQSVEVLIGRIYSL